MRVIVTRPELQAREWVRQLRDQLSSPRTTAADVIALPLIDIAAPNQVEPVGRAWQALATYRLVVFVSPSAAQWFFALRPTDVALRWPADTQAAAPGPGTGDVLIELGVPADQLVGPDQDALQFDSETLWERLGALQQDWHGAQVLMVCGGDDAQARGRPWLTQQLRAGGAQVHAIVTYQRGAPRFDAAQLAHAEQALRQPTEHIWLFSSSEAIAHLLDLQRARGWPAPGPASIAVATHPRIAETAQAAGFGQVAHTRPALPDVVASLHPLLSGLPGPDPVDTIISP